MHLASVLPLITVPLTLAKTISIGVGQGGLVFEPESVTADIGDLLQFHFYPKNHSVVQGSFSSPCQPLTPGVYSGFLPEETGEGVGPREHIACNHHMIHTVNTNLDAENSFPGHCEQHRYHVSLLLADQTLPARNGHGRQPPVSPITPQLLPELP